VKRRATKFGVGILAVVAGGVVTGVFAPPLRAQESYPLRRAIQVALANSRAVADAEYGLTIAEQQVREAWASALPSISGDVSYSRNLMVQEIFLPAEFFGGQPGEVQAVRVGSDNSWQLGMTLSQKLFEYSVFVGIGAASRFRELEVERVRGTTQQVVTTVRQAYFSSLLAESQLRLLEQSVARVLATLEETRALNRAGLASDYDVLRLDVEYANISANLQRARNAVTATRRTLLVEMGLAADLPAVLEGALEAIDPDSLEANAAANVEVLLLAGVPGVLEDSVAQLLETAKRRRTDLRQLRSAVLLEESRRRVEAAEFFPRLSLFSNYSLLAQEDGRPNFFGENEFQRTSAAAAGIQVEIPIFQGFKRMARMSQRTAAMRQNETRLARAEQDAVNQVRSLYEAVEEALQRARSQRGAVAQAGRGFEIASAEYREGIGSQLQVTDAEEALRVSDFNYAIAIHDYLVARAQLEMAIGLVPEEPGAFPVARNR